MKDNLTMTPLSAITAIPVDFGTPTDFSPPDISSLLSSIRKETEDMEGDGRYDAVAQEIELFESSLTPEELTQHNALIEAIETARAAFDPDRDEDTSPAAKAYHAALEARERFIDTHGSHMCFSCSHYIQPSIQPPPPQDFAVCSFNDRNLIVRPYCLACPHYTTGTTPKMERDNLELKILSAQHPELQARYTKEKRKQSAEKMAVRLNSIDNDITAFLIFAESRDYYKKLYADYPSIFQTTPFPTFDSLVSAYEKWRASLPKDTTTPPTTP